MHVAAACDGSSALRLGRVGRKYLVAAEGSSGHVAAVSIVSYIVMLVTVQCAADGCFATISSCPEVQGD